LVDNHAVGKVVEFNPRGKATATGAASFYGTFEGVAIDAAGNVYVLSGGGVKPSTIFKFVPGVSRSIFATGFGQGFGLAFDNAGNLYAADAGDQTIYKFTPDGTRTVFAGPSAFATSTGPVGLAFDSAGNLFVSTERFIGGSTGNDAIREFTPTGMESTFASGLTMPRGLAFDGSGNLFVAETLASPNGDILEFTTGGAKIVFASGIARPEFLTFGPAR
jgi:hypothetical protein